MRKRETCKEDESRKEIRKIKQSLDRYTAARIKHSEVNSADDAKDIEDEEDSNQMNKARARIRFKL
jgi:hypothetical protein